MAKYDSTQYAALWSKEGRAIQSLILNDPNRIPQFYTFWREKFTVDPVTTPTQPDGTATFSIKQRQMETGVLMDMRAPLADGTPRGNNDLRRFRGGVDLFAPGLHVKAYANGSKRGTPGSLSYPSTDRQDDVNGFVQASWVKAFTPRYELRVSAKGSYDKLYYHSQWGDSDYRQTEIQLNTAQRYAINSWLSASFAADLQWDGLQVPNDPPLIRTLPATSRSSSKTGLEVLKDRLFWA